MKSASAEYKQIMKRPMRPRGYMTVSVGVVNLEAQADANMSGDFTWYSNPNRVFTDDHAAIQYATYEQNYWKADGSMYFLPRDGYVMKQNAVSENILGSVTVNFGLAYDIKGLTINFGEYYPTELQIVSNGETHTYENNNQLFQTSDVFLATQSIDIIPISMVGGQQRLRINEITFGIGLTFQNDVISGSNLVEYCNAVAEELPYIEFDVDVLDKENQYNVDEINSTVNFLEIGQKISVNVGLELSDERMEWFNMATLFLSDWKSTRGLMTFKARDRLCFMDGRYNGSNRIYERTLYQEAITVLSAYGLEPDEYIVDDCLMDITVTNPLQNYTFAECLQFIANAGRCLLFQDNSGKIVIKANFANVIEPTDISVSATGQAPYSDIQSVKTGADVVYADYTKNFFSADGSMKFLPREGDYLSNTGFISNLVANSNGRFTTNPTLSLELEAGYIYYGIIVTFGGNAPQEIVIHTFYGGDPVEDVSFDQIVDGENIFNHEFETFDKVTIEVTKAAPNNRVIIHKVSFGDLSDYELCMADMYEYPTGIKEATPKSVSVRIFTYEESQGEPSVVDDDVWYTENLNTTGTNIQFENPLISTQAHAQLVAKWLGNYYKNNVSYNVRYRGEPRLDAGDIIYMESEVLNSLQTEIQKNTFTFNGAFSGSLELRRALKMMEDQE